MQNDATLAHAGDFARECALARVSALVGRSQHLDRVQELGLCEVIRRELEKLLTLLG